MLLNFVFGSWYVVTFIIAWGNSAAPGETRDDPDLYYPAFSPEADAFDWELLKHISKTQNGRNLLISPVSLKIVLALLYEGSSGATKKEFETVLNFPENSTELRKRFQSVLQALKTPPTNEYKLNFATRIFLDSFIHPQQNFAAKAFNSYNTNITSTNFVDQQGASDLINAWIQSVTNGRVQKLVSPEDVREAVMIMTNAVYFKGKWLQPFPKNFTETKGFYVNPTESVQVPFMTTSGTYYFGYSKKLDAKVLRIPYKGGRFAMFFVLPSTKAGLRNLVDSINVYNIRETLYSLDPSEVLISIPKFKFRYQVTFTDILQELGLRQMFQDTASFAGIARGVPSALKRLVVSDIIQKSGIDVDEEGSEIYAATDVLLTNKFKETDNVFNASHPFLFFVEEQSTGSLLFAGKVENPLETESQFPYRYGEEDTVQGLAAQFSSPNLQPLGAPPADVADVKRFNYFDLELLHELTEQNKNVFVSPASIKATLAMVLEGAYGKCAEEIRNVLRLQLDKQESRNKLQRLLYDLRDKSGSTVLESANAMFASNKLNINPNYQTVLNQIYNAQVTSVDFSNPQAAANQINAWVDNVTRGLISEIIGADAFSDERALVLLNALYFKGQWKRTFVEKLTSLKCFKTPTGTCINVPMMQVVDTFNYNYIPHIDAQAVVLPYNDDKYAMLVLLPGEKSNVWTLTRDLQHDRLVSILSQLQPTEVSVELPRFHIEYSADLVDHLKQLKIREIFSPNANLSGIIDQQNIRISNIFHKTRIDVNEKGTEAAAATGAVVIPLMGSSMPRFVANRPFVFIIYHVESGNIIFEGQLVRPDETLNVATRSKGFGQTSKTDLRNYDNYRQRVQPVQRTPYNYK